MVANIIANQSANTMMPIPAMAATIKNISLNDGRRQDPTFVSVMQGTERLYDSESNTYSTSPGNRYSVERYMPVPYDLTMQLDVITNNTDTKFQIIEQITTIFNPAVQLQQNDNAFDWSSIFEVTLKEVIYTNRNVPVGIENNHDIFSLVFEVPIWINPPARVKRQRIIEKIIANIHDTNIETTDDNLISRLIFTPGNHKLEVSKQSANTIQLKLLSKYGGETDQTWDKLLEKSGSIIVGTSNIILKTNDDLDSDIGNISITVTNISGNILTGIVDDDTLPPVETFSPVQIINPSKQIPGQTLPPASIGQNYLLIGDNTTSMEIILKNNVNWGQNLVAKENDIITFNGTNWEVIFSSNSTNTVYVKNIEDGMHFKFTNNEWIYTYLGTYNPGYWYIENLNSQT
jgi:hypothetical protein